MVACGCGQYRIMIVGAVPAILLLVALKLIERHLPVEKSDEARRAAGSADT